VEPVTYTDNYVTLRSPQETAAWRWSQ